MSSFYDRYLAPGDVRTARQQISKEETQTTEDAARPAPEPRIDAAHRARRQNALLFGGAAFTLMSALITRRSLARKKLPIPSAFTPSNAEPPKVDGGLEAIEAFGLATLNVFSISMMAAGGMMKIYDVADMEDMRDAVRRGVGYDVYGGESEADKEMEAWVADILSRKDGTGDLHKGIAEKLQELENRESAKKALEERRKVSS